MYPSFVIGGHTIWCRDLLINVGSGISILFILILYAVSYRKKPGSRGKRIVQIVLPMFLELLIVGTVGSVLATVVRGLSYPLADSLADEFVLIREAGGSHFIGIVLASACILPVLYHRIFKADAEEKLDIMAFFFPIQHVFNRIGCFMEGCCYGIPMSGLLSVKFPDQVVSYSVFPSQLFEAALMAFLFVCQWIAYRKGRHLFYPSMAVFGLSILVSECLMDQRGCVMYLGLTAIQLAAVLLIMVSVWGYWVQRRKSAAH